MKGLNMKKVSYFTVEDLDIINCILTSVQDVEFQSNCLLYFLLLKKFSKSEDIKNAIL